MNNMQDYIEAHSSPEPEVLEYINRQTNLNFLNPHMLSGHIQGRVLALISKMIRPRYILELGTYTGYSALCLAEGVREKVITIERNDELEHVIRRNLALSDMGRKVELHIGDCVRIVPDLQQEFDLVFIDADKRAYCAYLDLILPLVPHGGWIIADNTLWDGHVTDPAYEKDRQTAGLKQFNQRVAQDETLEKVILPLRDGMTIIRKS